uniref:Uncharacterized protein n=1 Tax=Arundo donax TaxID=35708 RepID=A0A0A9AE84_ARUDO
MNPMTSWGRLMRRTA